MALQKLQEDPNLPGLRRHEVANGFISFSPSMGIRIIAKMLNQAIVLFHVARHDAAYAWAEKHKVVVANNKIFELFEVVKSTEPKEAITEQFPEYGQRLATQMLAFGVPREISDEFRQCSDEDELLNRLILMSEEWQRIIFRIADGEQVDPTEIPCESSRVRSIAADPLLSEALTMPIAKWRLFLHPRQRQAVESSDARLVSVTGGPGTGKSVVIAHKAAHLARQLQGDDVVVVFGLYRNLVSYIRQMIGELFPQGKVRTRRIWTIPCDNVASRPANLHPTSTPSKDLSVTIEDECCYLNVFGRRRRIHGILVDEAHDCPKWFLEFIEQVLAHTDCNIVVLAHDLNQSVFRSNNRPALARVLKGASEYPLPFCFRMSKPILDNAFEIMGRYALELAETVPLERGMSVPIATVSGPDVKYISVDDAEQLAAKAKEAILRLRGRYAPDDIALVHLQYSSPHFRRRGRIDDLAEVLKKDSITGVHYQYGFWVKGLEFFAGVVVCPSDFMNRELQPADLLLRLNTMFVVMTRFRDDLTVIYERNAPAARYFPET